jgi:hypothetical protein
MTNEGDEMSAASRGSGAYDLANKGAEVMEFTLTGPSNPWWLTYVAGFGIAAIVLSWRVWLLVAKVVFGVYYVAAMRLWDSLR